MRRMMLLILLVALALAQTSPAAAEAIRWSPDGSRVAWIDGRRIAVVAIGEGTGVQYKMELVREGTPLDLAWTGQARMVWLEKDRESLTILQYRLDTSELSAPRKFDGFQSVSNVAFDPLTQQARFIARGEKGPVLFEADLTQNSQARAVSLDSSFSAFSLAPNAAWILTSSESSTMLLDCRDPLRRHSLCKSPWAGAVSWSDDGRRLAFLTADEKGRQVARIFSLEDAPKPMATVPATGLGQWNAAGDRLALICPDGSAGNEIGFYDTGREKFIQLAVATQYVGVVGLSGGSLAAILAETGPSTAFSGTRLIVFRPSSLVAADVAPGVVTARWGGTSLAFLCRSVVGLETPVTLMGFVREAGLNTEFVTFNDAQEMVKADMFCLSELYTAAAEIYGALIGRQNKDRGDVNFGLVARLMVARGRQRPIQNVEPQERMILHAMLRNPAVFGEVADAFRAVNARGEGRKLFMLFADTNREDPLAIRALVNAARLAQEDGHTRLARQIVFNEGITEYSSLLTTSRSRLKYDPEFFAILADQVRAKAPQVLSAEPNHVDVLTFLRELLDTLPQAAFKDAGLTQINLIIARVYYYRNRPPMALAYYIRALETAPEEMDQTEIWHEILAAEIKRAGIQMPEY